MRQNLTAPNAASATWAQPAMLDHGRSRDPDGSASDHRGEPTSKSRVREPGAAAAVGCVPSHPCEADRSLVRSAVLGRPPAGLAALEVGLGDCPTRHSHRLASPRLRVYWTRRSRPRGGRPQALASVRRLTREMARANPLWGAPRIHGELLKLGFDVSERTISRLMPHRRSRPSQTWRTFLENHFGSTIAIDFFAVPTLTCRILFVFIILAHDRRRILHVNVTPHPTSAWTRQQLREAFPHDANARFLLHDRDTIFDAAFGRAVEALGSRPSARHLARPGRIPTSNASSDRSDASAWSPSSSSMNGIFVGSFGPTWPTTTDLGRTSRLARMRRWHAPSNRPAASWERGEKTEEESRAKRLSRGYGEGQPTSAEDAGKDATSQCLL